MNQSEKAAQEYLENLRVELNKLDTETDEALSDAREFISEELAHALSANVVATSDEIYMHFVDVFGSPREVAAAYRREPSQLGANSFGPARKCRSYWMRTAAALAVLGSTVGLCIGAAVKEPPKLSPFTEVRFEGDKPVVRFRGELFDFVSLDDIASEKILQTSRDEFGGLWEKRFAEDLVEVLWRMKHYPKTQVKLELRDRTTGKIDTVNDAAMTEANRQQIWDARNDLDDCPKLSPFTEVRFDGDKAIVRVQGKLYELVSIDGLSAAKILQFSKDQVGDLWQKRFAEDLVEVLRRMGHRPKNTVTLELRNLESGESITIADAEMTEANRRQIWKVRNASEAPPKVSPFTEVRYEGDKAIVRVNGEEYELVSLDGIEAGKIVQSAKDHFGFLWQKRFAEDLVEVLWKMEHRPKSTVELQLRKPTSAEIITIASAEMTEVNRRQVRETGK